jgi:magnesium chelatase family protein
MSISVVTAAVLGVDAVRVDVEVDLLRRLPSVSIVGLPAPSVRESADRVRSALVTSGFEFPRARVVISLAPADLRKDGTGFDLPIAIGILTAAGVIDPDVLTSHLFFGELALSGELRPVRGTIAVACFARDAGCSHIVVPLASAPEAALVDGLCVCPARHLRDVVDYLHGGSPLAVPPAIDVGAPFGAADLRDVRGQHLAREALTVAAAGGHNLLMVGPPGCGKTMLASRLPSILPPLAPNEALECTRIHSVAGLHPPEAGIMPARPFRAPHHSVSAAGLVGGASLRPGEATLAHNGVLFLDELPEFPRHVRECLRAPLEERRVVLVRTSGAVVLPAAFMLVAAANPCPCGNLGHPTRPCTCTVPDRLRYQGRLSGPLFDRIDLRVELQPVTGSELLGGTAGEDSATVRERVVRARARQSARYGGRFHANAHLDAERVRALVEADAGAIRTLQTQMDNGRLSARVANRLLKVARTLADLDDDPRVRVGHLHRAIALRCEPDVREAA